jgi:hypothetical protein
MARLTIIRTDQSAPDEPMLKALRRFLFGVIDGFSKDDRRAWRSFWKRVMEMEPGEMAAAEMLFPRSGPFHRRHMVIEQTVFDAQERFNDFEMFRDWMKVGAGWVEWCAGPKGGVIPVPKSISYAKADEQEFRQFHDQSMAFLRGPHAARFLWKHLGEQGANEMMHTILAGFNE